MTWPQCPPQRNSQASVRELCLDRYLSPWRDSAGKTYRQTRLLDAPRFPNNAFPQQKCWFKLFVLTWVQDKVMWFLEPPHQVMNDVVMKRKFLAHCMANKDRIVKPLALLCLALPLWMHRFSEEPSTEEEGDFWTLPQSHFPKNYRVLGTMKIWLWTWVLIFRSLLQNPGPWSQTLNAGPCIRVLGHESQKPLGNYPGAWWNTFLTGWPPLTLLTSKQRWTQRG